MKPLSASIFCFTIFLAAACCGQEQVSPYSHLPEWKPPFQHGKAVRRKPEFYTESFRDSGKTGTLAGFKSGNKTIGVYQTRKTDDATIRIMIDGIRIGGIAFQGGFTGNWGSPFKSDAALTIQIDKKNKLIRGIKEYPLPDGKSAKFSWTLSEEKGMVKLTYDAGVPDKELNKLDDFKLYPHFWTTWTSDQHLKYGIWFDKTPFKNYSEEELKKAPGKRIKKISYVMKSDAVYYGKTTPLKAFAIGTPNFRSVVEEEWRDCRYQGKLGMKGVTIKFFPQQLSARGSIYINLGKTAEREEKEIPPVAGIDFYGEDAMQVPDLPGKNRMPNPGFEQGFRYWGFLGSYDYDVYTRGEPEKYSIKSDVSPFGKKALCIRGDIQRKVAWLRSVALPLKDKTRYTVSYYAKGKTGAEKLFVGPTSNVWGGVYNMFNYWKKNASATVTLTTKWQRYEQTFFCDNSGIGLLIGMPGDSGEALVDNIQIEEGTSATSYEVPEVEGILLTGTPDNNVEYGTPVEAQFVLRGKPNLSGQVNLELVNYYREPVYKNSFDFTLDKTGVAKISLPFEELGTGVFVLKATWKNTCDFYRMSVIRSLNWKHSNRDLFGCSIGTRHPRILQYLKMLKRCGFGSYTYGGNDTSNPAATIPGDFGFHCYCAFLGLWGNGALPKDKKERYMKILTAESITPEMEKETEELAYWAVKNNKTSNVWAFSNETESSFYSPLVKQGKFDEWAKVLVAFARGAKRARPEIKLLPDTGPANYTAFRGYKEIEGYLKSTVGKVKWDAVGIHPYHSLDGTNGWSELDEELAHLVATMKKYGYGKETSIYCTEAFNIKSFRCSAWDSKLWADHFRGMRPSYDSGLTEFLQAAWLARTYIIAAKYEQVKAINCWIGANDMFIGIGLDMTPAAMSVNTLGHVLDGTKYKEDIRPCPGVRGYIFERADGKEVAVVWCNIQAVENGFRKGPVLSCKFDEETKFIDLMGNPRKAEIGPNGTTQLQLSPAPLFVIGKERTVSQAFRAIQIDDLRDCITTSIFPDRTGKLFLLLKNQSSSVQSFKVKSGKLNRAVKVPSLGGTSLRLDDAATITPGKIHHVLREISMVPEESDEVTKKRWASDYIAVSYANAPLPRDPDSPQWDNIPEIEITNRYLNLGQTKIKHGHPEDMTAAFSAAWDEDNFYLRINVCDDRYVEIPEAFLNGRKNCLYNLDGCAEVYFDTGANALLKNTRGYDIDDYRYDFGINENMRDGSGAVWRLREPAQQLMGALSMPSKDEARNGVKCYFKRNEKGYRYTMIFPQRYLEPLKLAEGTRSGFSIFLHDRDDDSKVSQGRKGLSIATDPGAHCDYRPDLWPIMVLVK